MSGVLSASCRRDPNAKVKDDTKFRTSNIRDSVSGAAAGQSFSQRSMCSMNSHNVMTKAKNREKYTWHRIESQQDSKNHSLIDIVPKRKSTVYALTLLVPMFSHKQAQATSLILKSMP